MVHTNFKVLIPEQTRRRLREEAEAPEEPERPLPVLPAQATGEHDYYDACAEAIGLSQEAEA